jgi:sigma-E factor negative regulatory protein RseA
MSDRQVPAREALSALVDGEASPSEVAQTCAAWRGDADTRANWHEYQLIGDVMRSQDLAGTTPSAAFLNNFRARLAQEPVVLAPAAAVARKAVAPVAAPVKALRPLQRRTWTGPIAVAASFVAVVASLLGNQVGPDAGSGAMLMGAAQGDGLTMGLTESRMVSLADAPSFNKPDTDAAVLVRDPRVDQALSGVAVARRSADLSFSNAGALAQTVAFDQR